MSGVATSNPVGPITPSALPPPPPPAPGNPPIYVPPVAPTIDSCGLPGYRFYQSPDWNWMITNLDTSAITYIGRIASNKSITYTLNDATQAIISVPSDDKLVNIPYTDGDPKVDEGIRCLFGFRDEGTGRICRFAGLVMQAADTVSGDVPTSTITAWDPWRFLDMIPMVNVFSDKGDKGIRYIGDNSQFLSRHDQLIDDVASMIIDQLELAIVTYQPPSAIVDGNNGLFIDFGQTPFYAGTLEVIPLLHSHTIDNSVTIGQAMRDMCAQGLCDIVFTPVWDPINRPGILAELNVFYRAGSTHEEVVFGWDRIPRSLTGVDRQQDGTQRGNNVLFYHSRGGPPVSLKQDTTAQAKYGRYYKSRFFPTQGGNVETVEDLATAQLILNSKGNETITVSPTPDRAKNPLVDYNIGDTVRISVSDRLRKPVYDTYRVMQIPIILSDDGLESVQQLTLKKFLPSDYIGPFAGPKVNLVAQQRLKEILARRDSNSQLFGPGI